MQQRTRVLIAEDDFLVSEMIVGVAEKLGYVVVGKAADGNQAVEMTRSLRPDVVLMDVKMPDMDGIEATRRIQETCPTPVVVLTAFENPDLVQQSSSAGVGAYVVKPPKAPELDRAVLITMARFSDMMKLRRLNEELQERNRELQLAIKNVKTLSGLLRICAHCKKIRDDQKQWHQVEHYVCEHSEAQFTHGICPDCLTKMRNEMKLLKKR